MHAFGTHFLPMTLMHGDDPRGAAKDCIETPSRGERRRGTFGNRLPIIGLRQFHGVPEDMHVCSTGSGFAGAGWSPPIAFFRAPPIARLSCHVGRFTKNMRRNRPCVSIDFKGFDIGLNSNPRAFPIAGRARNLVGATVRTEIMQRPTYSKGHARRR